METKSNELDQLDVVLSDDESHLPTAHNKLLGAVSQLYEKKRVKAATRKEPSLEVSEFHLSQPDKKHSRVKVTDLARVLNKRATHAEIGQKLQTAKKRAKTLPKPLEKIHADKITRTAGYEHAKRQLNRWDAIVYKQKVAEQVTFPLKNESMKIHESTDILKSFRKPTELEIKLAELLKHPDPLAALKKEEEQENENKEKENDYPLSLAEIVEKRKMMARLRAQQSYRQTKAVRHSKIKSKKFHQIQKRARVKEQLKEFEELQKKDPEAALKKLEELERTRAEERVTLRHRSTGKWAKNQAVRAKYDKEARIALSEQLSKSRELTVKLSQNRESESEKENEEEEDTNIAPAEEDPNNPWVVKRTPEMEKFVSGYRKYWETKGKDMEKRSSGDTVVKVDSISDDEEQLQNKSPNNSKIEHNILNEKALEKSNCELSSEVNQLDTSIKDKINNIHPPSDIWSCEEVSAPLKTKYKPSVGKNVFNVNKVPVKYIKSNTIKSNTPTCFNVSKTSLKKKAFKDNCNSDSKLLGKSFNWTVSKSPNTKSKACNKRIKTFNVIEKDSLTQVNATGNLFLVTENKIVSVLPSPSKKINAFKGNGSSKKQNKNTINKHKSLDEMFEEVEDKLLERIQEKVNSIKGSLNSKKKNEIANGVEQITEEMPSLEMKRAKVFADIDEELLEQSAVTKNGFSATNQLSKTLITASAEVKEPQSISENIDPNKFLKAAPRQLLSSQLPDIMTEGDDALDDDETAVEDRHLTISEAFAEDDVVDQFQKEKLEEVKKNSVSDVDLTLPGWGNWAGHNMKPMSRRKRKKFVIKFPRAIPRRDTNRGNVIINEDADKPVKDHQVSEVPFPFTSVKEFEASIRAPLGSTWVPQTAHQKLTLRPVVTQLGAIIQPMDDSQLINKTINTTKKDVKHKKRDNKK